MGDEPVGLVDPGGMRFQSRDIIPFAPPPNFGGFLPSSLAFMGIGPNGIDLDGGGQDMDEDWDMRANGEISGTFSDDMADMFSQTYGSSDGDRDAHGPNENFNGKWYKGDKGDGDNTNKNDVIGRKGDGKGNDFRGGKQKDRDGDILQYPKEFRKWYHQNKGDYVLPDEPDPDLAPIYKEWKELGSPSSMIQYDGPHYNNYYPGMEHLPNNVTNAVILGGAAIIIIDAVSSYWPLLSILKQLINEYKIPIA